MSAKTELPVQCAWCKRWREGAHWVVRSPLPPTVVPAKVSHGICPPCVAKSLEGLCQTGNAECGVRNEGQQPTEAAA